MGKNVIALSRMNESIESWFEAKKRGINCFSRAALGGGLLYYVAFLRLSHDSQTLPRSARAANHRPSNKLAVLHKPIVDLHATSKPKRPIYGL